VFHLKLEIMIKECCSKTDISEEKNFETVRIEKTKNVCPMCEDFAAAQIKEQVSYAILSCEGACLRGEVSRQVANLISFSLLPDRASRICLGGAFTKDSGQRNLVRHAQRVIVLEGCYIECASRMMKGVIDNLNPEVIIVDRLYDFDKKLFGINEVSEQQIKEFANTAAHKVAETIK
jgi:uncharacterized metal-binding protein